MDKREYKNDVSKHLNELEEEKKSTENYLNEYSKKHKKEKRILQQMNWTSMGVQIVRNIWGSSP